MDKASFDKLLKEVILIRKSLEIIQKNTEPQRLSSDYDDDDFEFED